MSAWVWLVDSSNYSQIASKCALQGCCSFVGFVEMVAKGDAAIRVYPQVLVGLRVGYDAVDFNVEILVFLEALRN